LAEVLQHSGAKWGDRDNDNVRSALAGGLLRLMDALIISKQELQWFTYIKRAYDNCLFLIEMYTRKIIKKDSFKEYEKNKNNFESVERYLTSYAMSEVINIGVD